MESLIYLAPVVGVIALIFALFLSKKVSREDEGTDRMKEIAAAISDGAHAFLTAEYKILVIFIIVLFVLIALGIGVKSGIAFVLGTLCSILAGYFGMSVATKANVRTANAARTGGMNSLRIFTCEK